MLPSVAPPFIVIYAIRTVKGILWGMVNDSRRSREIESSFVMSMCRMLTCRHVIWNEKFKTEHNEITTIHFDEELAANANIKSLFFLYQLNRDHFASKR